MFSVFVYIFQTWFYSFFTVQHKNKAFHGYPCYKGNTNKLYKSSKWPNVLQWLKHYRGQTTTLIKLNDNQAAYFLLWMLVARLACKLLDNFHSWRVIIRKLREHQDGLETFPRASILGLGETLIPSSNTSLQVIYYQLITHFLFVGAKNITIDLRPPQIHVFYLCNALFLLGTLIATDRREMSSTRTVGQGN